MIPKHKWKLLNVVFPKVLSCSDDNIRTHFETANQELIQINDCFLTNKLYLIVETTKYMFFHKLTDKDNIPLKLPSLQLNDNIFEKKSFLMLFLIII